MKGAHFSTVYWGLPFVGGQPLLITHTPRRRRGSWSSLSLNPCSGRRKALRLKFRRWRNLPEGGLFGSVRELAKAEKINESYLCRVLRLTCSRRGSRKPSWTASWRWCLPNF